MPRTKGAKNKPKAQSTLTYMSIEKPVVVDSQPTYEAVLIPVEKLTYDPMNMREGIGESPDKEFQQDIENNGITNPLLVRPIKHGKYGVVAGSRRFSKGVSAGLKEFPCIVREMDDITALSRSLSENVYQKPVEAYVYQSVFNKLYRLIETANPEKTKNNIIAIMHKQTGKAESTIKGYLAIAENATPETKEAMKKGKLPDSRVAQEVARLPEEKQKEAIVRIKDKPRSTAHAIIEQVKNETKALTGKTAQPKPQTEPLFTTFRTIKDIEAIRKEAFNALGNNSKFTQDEWLAVEDKYKHYAFCVGVDQVLNFLEDRTPSELKRRFDWLFKMHDSYKNETERIEAQRLKLTKK